MIPFGLIVMGLGLNLFGYRRWKKGFHWSYFSFGFFREANYQSIPGGLGLIVFGIAVLPFTPMLLKLLLPYLTFLIMLLGLIFGWKVFKPNWVKWVEDNHQAIIPFIAVEIRDHGWPIENRKELEAWIMMLYKKYQVDNPDTST